MPANPNKLSQFWQELKRRKVIRVITVYAASAFVILELLSIIIEPLKLPEWTLQFAIVFLCIGFIIAVILSWIYDIHPEEGIVKTEAAHKVKDVEKPATSNSWKIASYISFVVIVALIILNVMPRFSILKETEILDKSIAVLPFKNDSPDQERTYFINGTMEAILDNLCKIKDLRVPSRTSMEQYRDNPSPIPIIAEEMNVSYILEGSGHRDGNRVRLFVQLLDGKKDTHLWSKTYDADIEKIFDMQSEIAQLVAEEIKAIITPEEKQLIEKIPTTNLTAYDFYQRGRDEHYKWWLKGDREALERAENLYHNALEYDKTFALAYIGLANVYWDKHSWESYFSESFMDSVLIFADKALSFDPQLSDAYTLRGDYYRLKGDNDQAIKEYDLAIKYNPNYWLAYRRKAWVSDDFIKAIYYHQKAASLYHGPSLPILLRSLSLGYRSAGFIEKGNNYLEDALKLDGDSGLYYLFLAEDQTSTGNYKEALELIKNAYLIDANSRDILYRLAIAYMYLDQYEKSLKYFEKYIEKCEELKVSINGMHWIGYVYWQNGFKKEAEYYFSEQIRFCEKVNELGRIKSQQLMTYYSLAQLYAFRGEKDKAFENLRIYNQKLLIPLHMVTMIKDIPLFDNIRDEPEFQQIVRDVEAKYQAEHERVRRWLEENDMP